MATLVTQTRSSMYIAAKSMQSPLLACFARPPTTGNSTPQLQTCMQRAPRSVSPRDSALSTSMRRQKSDEPYDPPNINRMQTDDSDSYKPRGPALFVPQFDMAEHVKNAWKHWEALGRPMHVMAPMVDQSELAFRAMGRKYGCDLAYTPMLHSKIFSETSRYRKDHFQTDEEDRPLVVQFCANNPATLLKAAQYVENDCDAVDLNIGCPQDIARRGKYGSFLMEDWDRIHDLILTLKLNLRVPVWAKIRVYPDREKTIAYAKMIEAAGASVICIHGRTREQKGNNPGPADLSLIRDVAAQLQVPVIANGNIQVFEDAQRVLDETGCEAVMSAVGLLQQPALFSGDRPEPLDMAREYLHFADAKHAHFRMVRPHIFQMLYAQLRHRPDLLALLAKTKQTPAGAVASYSPFLDRVRAEVGTLEDALAAQERVQELERAAAAAAEGERASLVSSSDDGVVSVELDGRRLSKSDYKALLRKQRTMQRTRQAFSASATLSGPAAASSDEDSVEGLAALGRLTGDVRSRPSAEAGGDDQAGGTLHDPFSSASRYYHTTQREDIYGEDVLEAHVRAEVEGGGRGRPPKGWFLVRRSNGDPFTAVSVTCITNDGTKGHSKIMWEEPETQGQPGRWYLASHGVMGEHEEMLEAAESASLDNLIDACFTRRGFYGMETPADISSK